ncbi:hypothetical protein [Xanthomonas arboricola]|uniref:hypothetical protein n=1 Tax=Xanthomonas arboricola TaxID=56448 RepID=UPI000AC1498C|nr:hypothetical protein [Xanthomonas arboricola]
MEVAEGLDAAPAKASNAEKVKTWWLSHHWVIRLYLGGAVCMLASIALSLRSPGSFSSDVAFYASCSLLAIAFLGDTYAWVMPKLAHPLMKISVTVFGAIALTAAAGVGRVVVNEATSQQASLFPTSSALLSLLSIVPVTATLMTVLGAIPAFLAMGWGLLKLSRSEATNGHLDVIVTLIRGLSAFVVLFGASALSNSQSVVYPAMRWVAAYSAFFLDLQQDAACAPLEGDKVARINDSLILVGRLTEAGPQFVRRTCALTPESTALRPQAPGRISSTTKDSKPAPVVKLDVPTPDSP